MPNLVAEIEVATLDQDLKEIYEDYGSESLYVLKRDTAQEVVDDLYGEVLKEAYSTPYPVLGRVTFDTSEEENTEVGKKVDTNRYQVNILKSSLDAHGIKTLSTDDKILYLGTELEIKSVKQNNILGDYFLHYKAICEGATVKNWSE